ncbi:hypothetical protein ACFE04_025327 [Oxalis oulophora]
MENDEPTRIFVGGLGENVTEDDVHKIFSSLSIGEIQGIQIIRTKGRSFAYFNMLPSSDKSLPKLFSTYNGCKWKGGRLKLEKAKEHYLNRLKREWAEDETQAQAEAQPPPEVKIVQTIESSNNAKPKRSKYLDTKHEEKLKIFFPKLGKVKSLPLSGTGKHKYSFQRPKLLAAPLHFCDCEEHAIPDHALACGRGKKIRDEEVQIGGMNDDEINLMGSVMKRLFERENSSKSVIAHNASKTELPSKGEDFDVKFTDNVQADDDNENENTEDNLQPDESDDEEDNLVLNFSSKSNDIETILGSWSQKPISNLETNLGSKKCSKPGPVLKATQEVTENIPPNKKKRKTRLSEENDIKAPVHGNAQLDGNSVTHIVEPETEVELGAEPTLPESGIKKLNLGASSSRKSSWKTLVGDNETSKSPFSVSDLLTNASKEQPPKSDSSNVHDSSNSKKKLKKCKISKEKSEKTKVEPSEVVTTNKTSEGSEWFQKHSWTQMVSESNSSFSITQILPSVTSEKQSAKEPVAVAIPSENSGGNLDMNKKNPVNNVLTTTEHEREGNVKNPVVDKQDIIAGNVEASNPSSVVGEHIVSENKTSISDTSIGETCTFMRSDASEKEWKTLKAALNRINKRQSDKKK